MTALSTTVAPSSSCARLSTPSQRSNCSYMRTQRTWDGWLMASRSVVRALRKKWMAASADGHSACPMRSRNAHTITPVRPLPALQCTASTFAWSPSMNAYARSQKASSARSAGAWWSANG